MLVNNELSSNLSCKSVNGLLVACEAKPAANIGAGFAQRFGSAPQFEAKPAAKIGAGFANRFGAAPQSETKPAANIGAD